MGRDPTTLIGRKDPEKVTEALISKLAELTPEQKSGIWVFVYEKYPTLVLIDTMDWGDKDVSNQLRNIVKKTLGEEYLIAQNEGAKPQEGDGWLLLNHE